MNSRLISSLLVASCAIALGGCQLLGPSQAGKNSSGKSQQARAADDAHPAPWTQMGREHLRAHQNGLAIEAFNRAIAYGEEPAAAFNGLGVAYSRLGRTDLAYRFFKKATLADPVNPLYSRNLVTLTNSPAFTLAVMRRAEPAAAPLTQLPAETAVAAAPVAPREPGKLYRESNRQFTLVTRPAADDPAVGATRTAKAACAARKTGAKPAACRADRMPTVASRNVTPRPLKVERPIAAAVTDRAPAESSAPAAGKRKVVDIPATMDSRPGGAAPAKSLPAAAS
jgi:hypothetical protein